jgi:7-cyano-7-deazaguanine synthase in queuosine biosynthesis
VTWHVITRVGTDDSFVPEIAAQEPRIEASFERSDDPWQVGNDVLERIQKVTGSRPSDIAIDLLYLAMAVYTADLRIPRRFAEDRWAREIALYVPVGNLATWTASTPQLVKTLNYLTGDRWQLHVRERRRPYPGKATVSSLQCDSLSLFSGGLDSLAGAIDLLAAGQHVALIGHHGAGMANAVQERVLKILEQNYKDKIARLMLYAQPPKRKLKDGEPSMRSRSFLFLALGVASATALTRSLPLVIAENGLISLNVPLTPARIGSASTRTTHPHFIDLYRRTLEKLGIDVPLVLPYRFKTKGEMLAEAKDQDVLKQTAALTMSCSHSEAGRYQGFTPGNHCGYCVPCIIRRAAMEHAGLSDATYNIDVRKTPPDYRKEAGRDFRAFEIALERFSCTNLRESLATVMATAPLPPEDAKAYANVYQRGMEEVARFMKRQT